VHKKPATPRIAAATILLDQDSSKVLWARRNPELKFLGGFHGFTGGKIDPYDSQTEVRNCSEPAMAPLIAGAAREMFEEIGILLVRNGDKLTVGQRASLHDDLISGRSTFAEILELWGLWIDAEDFVYTGFWTTPEFSPMRFKTHFFIAVCPPKQKPYRAVTEMQEIEFIEARKAFHLWETSKVLLAPPVLITIKELAENSEIESVAKNLLEKSTNCDGNINYIELHSRLICLPLRTETLPPATHTNCFIVGRREFVIIDAATPFSDEQEKLFEVVDEFIEKGYECKEICVSHLHPDHFGGETALQKHLNIKFNSDIPISAHQITAGSLAGKVKIDRLIENEQTYTLKDKNGDSFQLTALHTPGHARGHLCFYDKEFGFLLSSDNVVGLGTVVIAPPEGNMIDYLDSLEGMKNLPGLNFLCGSHGSAVFNAKTKIEGYIEHRREREEQVLQAVKLGLKKPSEIVPNVYTGLDPQLIPLAEKSVQAHLEKLISEDRISIPAEH
jgi:glyoxylase-like metal-dependent hydrolase (beta-lactamase superfamily II)/8-oxo-dGTP pyrophosphatase MutT (NUDIX family)